MDSFSHLASFFCKKKVSFQDLYQKFYLESLFDDHYDPVPIRFVKKLIHGIEYSISPNGLWHPSLDDGVADMSTYVLFLVSQHLESLTERVNKYCDLYKFPNSTYVVLISHELNVNEMFVLQQELTVARGMSKYVKVVQTC